jgi:hypothetical protein
MAPTLAITAGAGTAAAPAVAVQGWAFLARVRRDCMKAVPKMRSASYPLCALHYADSRIMPTTRCSSTVRRVGYAA